VTQEPGATLVFSTEQIEWLAGPSHQRPAQDYQEAEMYQPSSDQLAQYRIADWHSQATRQALARTARRVRRARTHDGRNLVTRVLAERLRAVARVRTA
jgi:hypothetical protein